MHLSQSNFKNERKKLKKHYEEDENLEKILILIRQSESVKNPFFNIYGFERLKHVDGLFYSFNLSKNGGTIRLIVTYDEKNNIINLVYISMNHYDDFKEWLKINKKNINK